MILDVDKFFEDAFPIVLSTDADLEEGENLQLDAQALSNFFDTPMVIDEIRVQIKSPDNFLTIGNFGGSIRLKLTLGRYALTDVYVPVGCLGPTFDGGTIDNAVYQVGTYSPECIPAQFSTYQVGFFRWKLPRPLVVPVGMPLEAKISRQIEGLNLVYPDNTTVSVNVAYVGRVTKKRLPKGITVPIPYVGLYENVFTSASVAVSGQRDLYNPFQSPLTVQRLIGRWQNIYLDSGTPQASLISLDANGSLGSTAIDFPLTQIRLFDGFNVTNRLIPGASIWEENTRAFNMNVELGPREGFEVTIDATAGVPSTGAQPSPDGSNTSLVTMIGWRNEDL